MVLFLEEVAANPYGVASPRCVFSELSESSEGESFSMFKRASS